MHCIATKFSAIKSLDALFSEDADPIFFQMWAVHILQRSNLSLVWDRFMCRVGFTNTILSCKLIAKGCASYPFHPSPLPPAGSALADPDVVVLVVVSGGTWWWGGGGGGGGGVHGGNNNDDDTWCTSIELATSTSAAATELDITTATNPEESGTTDQETPTASVSSSLSGVIGGAVGGLVGAILFVTAAVVTVVGLVVGCRRKKKYSGKMCNMSDATGY